MNIVVPRAVLPTEMQGRADLLDRYFCELLATAHETANGKYGSLRCALAARTIT